MIINNLKHKKYIIILHRIDIDNNYKKSRGSSSWICYESLNYIFLKHAIKRTANELLQKLSKKNEE